MKHRLHSLVAVILSVATAPLHTVAAADALFERFSNPPAEARPFVRWWWNGNCVGEAELIREIEVMREAGIGGFEINIVALADDPNKVGTNGLTWLSPEWNRMVRVAADAARQRGMIADLTVGTGWPFGGEFLKPGQMTRRVYVNAFPVEGPAKFSRELATLLAPPTVRLGTARPDVPKPRFLFARLAPETVADLGQTTDLTGRAGSDGTLAFDIPPGRHVLYVGAVQEGFARVNCGVRGGDGPVLNHYDKPAVHAYLQRMADGLGPALGGKLGPRVRALFCDSIELAGANWTADFAEQFESRRGYDVTPFLPFIVDFTKPIAGDGAFADTLRRARYDFSRTLVELFQERFTRLFHDWCHANGALSRFQAYGHPWLLGMLDGYTIPDIPESNNWLFTDPESHGFLVWTKYASSGGHLAGRRIISTEAMTNVRGVFQTTLDQVKAADDLNFIMGINHSVLHGFNYSPREAGFPGWVRFGTYFSEQNTWWPYFKHWSAYNARLSAVLQATRPVVRVAVLGPEADLWSEHGLERLPFHNQPWYVHQLWKAISNCGSSADYLSENVVQSATFDGGKFRPGPMAYDTLIVAGARSLQPATAEALLKFADAGGRIVFAGELPQRSPSLKNATANDNAVRQAINAALEKHAAKVTRRDAPPSKKELVAWTDALLTDLGVTRSVRFSKPDEHLYQIHHRDADRDVFFLANTDATGTVSVEATFDAADKSAWRWEPETGRREPCVAAADGRFAIELRPLESLLLVFESGAGATATPSRGRADEARSVLLDDAWQGEFLPARGKVFTRESFVLANLGASADPELSRFAGTVMYRKELQITDLSTAAFLDLGRVHGVSQVTLNGKPLGVCWYGRHVYDIRDAARQGRNQLEVKVTTVLWNYIRTLPDNPTAKGWMQPANKQPVPAGLVGPVTLRPADSKGP